MPEVESCDTLDVSFSSDIVPILGNNLNICHNNANAPDFSFGLSKEDYDDVSAMANLIVRAIKLNAEFDIHIRRGYLMFAVRLPYKVINNIVK